MKLPKEIVNGFIIFIAIAIYFLLMEALNLAHLFYLRFLNVIFVFYGVNKTIQQNLNEGKKKFISNAISALFTSVVGVILSIIALVLYSHLQGGDAFVKSLSEAFLFGGNPSIDLYSISLLFEGIASSVIVTLMLMLYWNNQFSSD
ncbi:MAG: hypothetical protein B7Y83_07075 [Flavobacteriales bacterium 32-34-25]|nr:MAG: hypothetical protein B7Y83_07075 [Flavobacteriales bacterium 32-34-25]